MFLFSLVWASPFFPFSFFVSLSLVMFFLPSLLFFISLSGSFIFFLFGLLLGSRCYVVFPFLLVVFFCFESSCLIYFCFVSCFILLVVFGFCCFHILYFFEFWLPIKKHLWKKWKLQKNQKWKMHKKRTFWQEQLAQVCLQIVSFFLFCVSLNFALFAENTIKIGVSAKTKKKKNTKKNKKPSVKNWSKLALKTGPSMLRNKIGPVFNARNVVFFLFLSSFFLKIPLLSAGRMRFSKTKKQKKWTSF